jgi:hypothetical protein
MTADTMPYGIPPLLHEALQCSRRWCRRPALDGDDACYRHSLCEKNDRFNWVMGISEFSNLVKAGKIVPHPMRTAEYEEPEDEEEGRMSTEQKEER